MSQTCRGKKATARPTITMMGHFPPPVHGMAVAFALLADAFESKAHVERLITSPSRLERGVAYHLRRSGRWMAAVVRLVRLRRRSRVLILSVDAGHGMIYVIIATGIGRVLGYRIYLQHHSYAYINAPRLLMRILAKISKRSTHLCSCDRMTNDLCQRYRDLRLVRTLPLAYAVQTFGQSDNSEPTRHRGPRLRIGHFSNLTMEKGLGVALDTLDAAVAAGLNAELVLAGPLVGQEERERVSRATVRPDGRVRYVGAVYGSQRDAYLRSIDVLLFPSRYQHESFGLAFWEALSLGTPAIAYRAGCLSQELVGKGAAVLEVDAPFIDGAIKFIRNNFSEATSAFGARRQAQQHATSEIQRATSALQEFVGSVCQDAMSPLQRVEN